SQAILEALASNDPADAERQRGLSLSHDKIGDVLRKQGDLAGALEAYRTSHAIAEAIARRDPDDTGAQRDLIVSYVRFSELERTEASKHLSRALEIAFKLLATGRLSPNDAWIPDDLKRRLAALGDG